MAAADTEMKLEGETVANKEEDTEMKEEPKQEEPKEEPKEDPEKEEDAPEDQRPKIKDLVACNSFDSTLDAFVSEGNVLTALSADGFQYLVSGVRANAGIKKGRYFFEVRILESLMPSEVPGQGRAPMPRQFVRMGFSKARSSLILGNDADNVCFESEGHFWHNGRRTQILERFGRQDTIGCLLNLDSSTPNANTVSLFKNGKRISDPQPLPESLQGQTLYPHVCFKNASIVVNYKEAWVDLPFKCRNVQDAAKDDVELTTMNRPKDGKYEVVFPVGLPDEGVFDWCDQYIQANPKFTEVSDRKIKEWCEQSGLRVVQVQNKPASNDRPFFGYGLPQIDDLSVRNVISFLAAHMRRHVVVVEVSSNLLKPERETLLANFAAPHYKKVATVIMGEPNREFIKKVHQQMLDAKKLVGEGLRKIEEQKQRAEQGRKIAELVRKRAEEKRIKDAEAAQKKAEEARKKAEEDRIAAQKKAEEAALKAAEEAVKIMQAAQAGETPKEEVKQEDKEETKEEKEETKDVEMKKEEEEKDVEMKKEEEVDEEMEELKKPIVVEMDDKYLLLNDEEKKIKFRRQQTQDCSSTDMRNFNEFSLPEKSEGFDEVNFLWSQKTSATKRMKEWITERKITQRIEDLEPSEWFKEKSKSWAQERSNLQEKVATFKKKKIEIAQKKAAEEAQKKEEEKKAQEEAKKKEEEEAKKKEEEEKKSTEEGAEKKEGEEAKEGEEGKKDEEAKKEEEPVAAAAPPAAAGAVTGESPKPPTVPPCFDYFKRGSCTRGVTCRFTHDSAAIPGAMPTGPSTPGPTDNDLDVEPEFEEELDIWDCDDPDKAGDDGEPLYFKFDFEDWALLNLKYEMHLLAHAYAKDVDDAERPGIYVDNIGYYYQKYFGRPFNTAAYGCNDFEELMALVKFVVNLDPLPGGTMKILTPELSEESETPMFLRLVEEDRQERKRQINLGNQAAKLKFQLVHQEVRPKGMGKGPGKFNQTPGMGVAHGSVGQLKGGFKGGIQNKGQTQAMAPMQPGMQPMQPGTHFMNAGKGMPMQPMQPGPPQMNPAFKRPFDQTQGQDGGKGGKYFKGDGKGFAGSPSQLNPNANQLYGNQGGMASMQQGGGYQNNDKGGSYAAGAGKDGGKGGFGKDPGSGGKPGGFGKDSWKGSFGKDGGKQSIVNSGYGSYGSYGSYGGGYGGGGQDSGGGYGGGGQDSGGGYGGGGQDYGGGYKGGGGGQDYGQDGASKGGFGKDNAGGFGKDNAGGKDWGGGKGGWGGGKSW